MNTPSKITLSMSLRRRARALLGTLPSPEVKTPDHSHPHNPATSAVPANLGTVDDLGRAILFADYPPKYGPPLGLNSLQLLAYWRYYKPRRFDEELRLQDALDDARRERAERGLRGLAKVFSGPGWRVLRAKMQLLLHGFPIPRRNKAAIRLREEMQLRNRLQRAKRQQLAQQRTPEESRDNGTSPASTTAAAKREGAAQ